MADVPISGRQLTLPDGPIYDLCRADRSEHVIGAFRGWAGYRDLGSDSATDGLALFQHVLSFGASDASGRTGIHCHLAHAHIVIPTSGRGVFSYDGVVTEAVPGVVIAQHGGTVHDQFEYSYKYESVEQTRRTPLSVDPAPPGVPVSTFGFLELFVPTTIANVEIVPPALVTEVEQRSAWDHPYHTEGSSFAVQTPDAPEAAYRPVVDAPELEARDAGTWEATGGLVATWIVRPATPGAGPNDPVSLDIPDETGGVTIYFVVSGWAEFVTPRGEEVTLNAGDTLTISQGLIGDPTGFSPDMRMVRFFIAARAAELRERTAEEIEELEALGPKIITRQEVRPEGDTRPVNFLREEREAAAES